MPVITQKAIFQGQANVSKIVVVVREKNCLQPKQGDIATVHAMNEKVRKEEEAKIHFEGKVLYYSACFGSNLIHLLCIQSSS